MKVSSENTNFYWNIANFLNLLLELVGAGSLYSLYCSKFIT